MACSGKDVKNVLNNVGQIPLVVRKSLGSDKDLGHIYRYNIFTCAKKLTVVWLVGVSRPFTAQVRLYQIRPKSSRIASLVCRTEPNKQSNEGRKTTSVQQ